MTSLVYVLCALLSLLCAILLVRAFRRTRSRLLFWSAVCFCGLFLQNIVLVVDKSTPAVDLSLPRIVPALVGVLALLHGLIWETR